MAEPQRDSVLESILARMTGIPPAGSGWDGNAGYPAATDPQETYTDYASGYPIEMKRKKNPFPELAQPPAPAPALPGLTQQAGILAPGIGTTADAAAAAAAAPPPPDPSPVPAPAPGTPLPVPRPAAADAPPADAALPPNAAPTAGQDVPPVNLAPQPPAAAPAAPAAAPDSPYSLPSILDRMKTTLGGNSNTLLALGAGFAGAPNWGQAISRAASAAIPARAADIKQQLQQQSITYGTKALVDAGVPIQQAIAAQGDPEMKKALIQSYITDRGKDIKMIKSKDSWGNETEVPYVVNKFPKDGEPVMTPAFTGAGGGASAPPGSAPPSGQTFAPGITAQTFDHTKVGEDYIKQYSPEMQASMKSYLAGQSLPTGRQLPIQMVKMAAQKYGDDIGMPGDDTSISQRKVWANSLGNTQNGVGLQSKGFQQGLEHFAKLSDNLVAMHLSNGLGIEPIAGVVNSAKNLTTEQQRLVHKSDVEGQALAREMGNLFSKNGGGVHEAAETKKNVSNSTMSSKAAAGSLEAIDELMQGGLKTLEQRRDELFPNGNAPKGSTFLGPQQQAALEHIRNNIAILKGEKPEAAAPAPAAAAPVRPTINGPNGPMILSEDGKSWQPMH